MLWEEIESESPGDSAADGDLDHVGQRCYQDMIERYRKRALIRMRNQTVMCVNI